MTSRALHLWFDTEIFKPYANVKKHILGEICFKFVTRPEISSLRNLRWEVANLRPETFSQINKTKE